MGQIIPFPAHSTKHVAAARPPVWASKIEEAKFHVQQLRAERDTSSPSERRHHLAIIKLGWWEPELFQLLGRSAATTPLGEAR